MSERDKYLLDRLYVFFSFYKLNIGVIIFKIYSIFNIFLSRLKTGK